MRCREEGCDGDREEGEGDGLENATFLHEGLSVAVFVKCRRVRGRGEYEELDYVLALEPGCGPAFPREYAGPPFPVASGVPWRVGQEEDKESRCDAAGGVGTGFLIGVVRLRPLRLVLLRGINGHAAGGKVVWLR